RSSDLSLALRILAYELCNALVVCGVVILKPGLRAPVVIRRQVPQRAEVTREEAAPERAVCDEHDPELATRRKHSGFRLARPERVLGLHRRNRVHCAGAA